MVLFNGVGSTEFCCLRIRGYQGFRSSGFHSTTVLVRGRNRRTPPVVRNCKEQKVGAVRLETEVIVCQNNGHANTGLYSEEYFRGH